MASARTIERNDLLQAFCFNVLLVSISMTSAFHDREGDSWRLIRPVAKCSFKTEAPWPGKWKWRCLFWPVPEGTGLPGREQSSTLDNRALFVVVWTMNQIFAIRAADGAHHGEVSSFPKLAVLSVVVSRVKAGKENCHKCQHSVTAALAT